MPSFRYKGCPDWTRQMELHIRQEDTHRAAPLLARHTFEGVSAAQLAKVTRGSVGAMYRHYGSKEAVRTALLKEADRSWPWALRSALARRKRPATFAARFLEVWGELYRFLLHSPDVMTVAHLHWHPLPVRPAPKPRPPPEEGVAPVRNWEDAAEVMDWECAVAMRRAWRAEEEAARKPAPVERPDLVKLLEEELQEGVEAGEVDASQPVSVLAAVVWGGLLEFFKRHVREEGPHSREEVEAAGALLLRMLLVPKAPPAAPQGPDREGRALEDAGADAPDTVPSSHAPVDAPEGTGQRQADADVAGTGECVELEPRAEVSAMPEQPSAQVRSGGSLAPSLVCSRRAARHWRERRSQLRRRGGTRQSEGRSWRARWREGRGDGMTEEAQLLAALDAHDALVRRCAQGELPFRDFEAAYDAFYVRHPLDGHEGGATFQALLARHESRVALHRALWEHVLTRVVSRSQEHWVGRPEAVGFIGEDEALVRVRRLAERHLEVP